jgi:CHAT domain-containing protein
MVFEKQFPEYHNLKYNTKTTTVKSIQELLDNKTAMISYVVGGSTVTIFTLTKSNFGVQTVPIIKNLNDSITWFRYGLTKTSSRMQEYYRRIGFLLYQQLFPESATIDKNIENLIIIPDGVLATIPYESLLTSNYTGDIDDYKSYPFLIKKYNISYSYSANLFYRTFSKQKSPSIEITKLNDWLAFAPVFDNSGDQTMVLSTRELQKQLNWLKTDSLMTNRSMFDRNYITPLPATETETEAILKLYDEKNLKAKVLLHDNANEKFIKSGELAKYRMLHFATHGFVNSERPELSGLLLAQDTTGGEDGVLYSGEIYNLKLNADLVVLSACETGLGKIQKGEGIIGLTRALLYAGAKNMIVSLWQVADESTSDLMVDFYKNSLENKGQIAYSEALRNAKLKMISEGRYAHPLYWSPFILIGK